MDTAQVAYRLVELCRAGQFEQAVKELYSPDIVSVEGFAMGEMPRKSQGIQAVAAKGQWWSDNHTIHKVTVSDPCLAEDKFAVIFDMDVTFKPTNQKQHLHEIAVYTVSAGKIAHEEFLYAPH